MYADEQLFRLLESKDCLDDNVMGLLQTQIFDQSVFDALTDPGWDKIVSCIKNNTKNTNILMKDYRKALTYLKNAYVCYKVTTPNKYRLEKIKKVYITLIKNIKRICKVSRDELEEYISSFNKQINLIIKELESDSTNCIIISTS